MLKVSTGADELELALERRLAALEALYLDAPIRAQISQNEPADPFLTVAQLIVTGFIWTMAAVCSWPFEGLGFPAFTIVILVLVALIGGSTAIEFDGRWLRVQHRLFGMRCWGSSADLTRFNAVVLTPYSVETEKGGPDWRTRLSLVSTVGSVEVGSGSQGEVEIGELTRRVREWIVIASREAELDS